MSRIVAWEAMLALSWPPVESEPVVQRVEADSSMMVELDERRFVQLEQVVELAEALGSFVWALVPVEEPLSELRWWPIAERRVEQLFLVPLVS